MTNSLNIKIATALSAAMLLSAPISAQAFVATEGQSNHWISPSVVTATGSIQASPGSVSTIVYSEGQQNRDSGSGVTFGARSNPAGSPATGSNSYGHSYGEGQQKGPPAFPAR